MLKKYIYIFLISMVPLIELRGAVPVSQVMGLPIVPSFIVCIIANMLPVPIIYLFARKVLNDFFEPYADELVAWGAIPLKKNIEKIQ